MEALHFWELDIIRWLHSFRTEDLDSLFRGLNFFDTDLFYFFILPIIWLGYDWRWGAKICFILMFSFLLTIDLKEFFANPRPFMLLPDLKVIEVKGYGLPSGAALTSTAVWIWLALSWKKTWGWILACCYILVLSFSRIYLGVHFFSDIILGWILGLSISLLSYKSISFLEKWFLSATPVSAYLVIILVPSVLFWIYPTIIGIPVAATCIGAGNGLFFAYRKQLLLKTSTSWVEGMLRACIGLFGVITIFTFFKFIVVKELSYSYVLIFLKFFLCGIWISALAPIVCKTVRRAY